MTDTWEHNPHEVADSIDMLSDVYARTGKYEAAATLHTAAQMLHDLWEQENELRAALTDLVFQCEKYPHIQTDRAKAVLYPSET